MAYKIANNADVQNTLTAKRTIPSIANSVPFWATAVSYLVNDIVVTTDKIYRCLINHTSGTFITDLSLLNWKELSEGIKEVNNFADLALLPADNGDVKLVTNESGRSYLLRYNSDASFGLVSSSLTLPQIEVIGTDSSTDEIETASAHGLAVNDTLVFQSSSTVGIITPDVGVTTIVYVKTVTSPTKFTFSLTSGGATFDITGTIGSPSSTGTFVTKKGWWNVTNGNQQRSESVLTPRIIEQNGFSQEYKNAQDFIFWETDRETSNFVTSVSNGGVASSNNTTQDASFVFPNYIRNQNTIDNTAVDLKVSNAALTTSWLKGELANVEKLAIYTYPGNPNTFIAANKGAINFDPSTGLIWRKTTDTVNTGWTNDQLLSTKTANYTYLESDEIIEVNTTASAVQITLPATLTTGKKVTIVWIAGANALTIVSTKNMIDFDGVPKLSVTPAALNTTYVWINGSVNYQLT